MTGDKRDERPGPSFGRRLTDLARRRGTGTALVFAAPDGTERVLGWAELECRANRTARILAARGVVDGDLVAVGLPNSPEHVVTTFAAWKLGASVLPLRWDLPAWERDRILGLVSPQVVVGDDWGDEVPGCLGAAEVAGDVPGDAALGDDPGPPPGEHAPPYERLIPSGGSTGSPKIIGTPWIGRCAESDEDFVPSEAVRLAASPLYHANGFSACYPALLEGARVVLMGRFDAARLVDLVERHRITHAMVVPTMLQRVARLDGLATRDLSSIEEITFGGASLPAWVARVWLQIIEPRRMVMVYGGSERHGAVACTGEEWLARPGTTGRGADCEVLVLDPVDHRPLPAGEVGEVWLRRHDPTPTFCYLGRDTPGPLDGDLWSFGDMGRLDDDGYLFIADRRQDMIVTGGVNVFPAEVEAALSEHPEVLDVVVIGIPDPEWGRRVHAVLVARRPEAPPDPVELRAWSRQRLSAPKIPKEFEFVGRLPRNGAGKINRSRLADERTAAAS